MTVSAQKRPRGCSTICLPIGQELYQQIIDLPERFRAWLDQAFLDSVAELYARDPMLNSAFARGREF